MYVPVVPVPETRAVIVVPAVTPVPEITSPFFIVPDVTAETVSVVPAIVPENEAVLVPVIATCVTTVCEVLTVYVPVVPVPETRAVIVVPAVTSVPEIDWPTASFPDATAVTVSAVPMIVPENETVLVPVIAKATVCEVLTVYVPVFPVPETFAVIVVPAVTPAPEIASPIEIVPDVQDNTVNVVVEICPENEVEPLLVSALEATVCEVLTVYVPVVPVPETRAVIVVPANTPVPEIDWPTASFPEATTVTVNVVVEILPVNEAAPLPVIATATF